MRRLSWLWSLALLFAQVGSAAPSATVYAQVQAGATLTVLAPTVEVSSAGGTFAAARDGQTVNAGDQVRTGPTGVALLTFFDGSETQLTSSTTVQMTNPAPGNPISVLQSVGTSVSRVVPPSSTGGFQVDTAPATAFVRGTTFTVSTRPQATSSVLLADPDGRVGRLDLDDHAGGVIQLTNACDLGQVAGASTLNALDPQTCAQLQASVANLRDPTAAAVTKQIAEQSNGGGGSGPGGGNPPPPPPPPPPPGGDSGNPASGGGGEGSPPGDDSLAQLQLTLPQPGGAAVFSSGPMQTKFGIGEGYKNPQAFAETGATWQRVIVPWRAVQPSGPTDFSGLGKTLPDAEIQAELSRGVKLSGLLQFTPPWAAARPEAGERSPPKNLDLPIDDPNNYWARFVMETVKHYQGRIDEWIVWNEPEFRPGDPGAGGSYTWQGTDEEFARLMKVAYLAAKKVNPNATVSFPGTSYWVEKNIGRTQFYERILSIFSRDPEAPRNHWFHDVTALNIYRNADDILRISTVFKAIQKKFGLEFPLWLTETNAMPTDDKSLAPCDHAVDSIATTMAQQAAFAVQAMTMGAAAGYQRVGFYQMTDDNACQQPAVWGAVRDNGSHRPVFETMKMTVTREGGATEVIFVPVRRVEEKWPVWPYDPESYWPNWQIYNVVFKLPDGRRTTVLWNADGKPICVHVPRNPSAKFFDMYGAPVVVNTENITLPPATAHFLDDPNGYFFIGGDPVFMLEEAVPPSAPPPQPTICEA